METIPKSHLETILGFIDWTLFNEAFPAPLSKKGRKGYSKESLFKALIGMQVSQLAHITELVNRLKTDPIFKRTCGFQYKETPSKSTFSRFVKLLSETDVLEKTYTSMLHDANEKGLLDASTVAIDATKIDAYEHSVPKSKIPEDDPEFPNWGGKLDTNGNFIKWFGWKMHALVDAKSGITLTYCLTPANIPDMDIAETLIKNLKEVFYGELKPKYYVMDAGYDKLDLYKAIFNDYKGQSITPINWRSTKTPPEGINFEGQLICPMNFPYVYGGNDKGTIRLLCPHVKGKCDCPMGSEWCTSSPNGYVGKARIKDNPRFVTAPFRGTDRFKTIYNKRTSVERTFGDLKDNYALDNIRVHTMRKAKVFVDTSCISLLADRLSKAAVAEKTAA